MKNLNVFVGDTLNCAVAIHIDIALTSGNESAGKTISGAPGIDIESSVEAPRPICGGHELDAVTNGSDNNSLRQEAPSCWVRVKGEPEGVPAQ